MNCFLTTGNICIYHLCFKTWIGFVNHSFILEYEIWIKISNIYPLSGVEISSWLLNDDESSDSGFIACCVDCFNLEEGPGEPSSAETLGDLWTLL